MEDGFGSRLDFHYLGRTRKASSILIHESDPNTPRERALGPSLKGVDVILRLCYMLRLQAVVFSCVHLQPCFKVTFGSTICYKTRLNVSVYQRFADSMRGDDCL